MSAAELAHWIPWRTPPDADDLPSGRVYLGEETCQRRLPTPAQLAPWLAQTRQRPVTLVTPPLDDRGLCLARDLVDALAGAGGDCEVVCNDWGLLRCLRRRTDVALAAGRLLAGQPVDPRLARMFEEGRPSRTVTHLDGARCTVRPRLPGPELADHLRRPSLDRPATLDLLRRWSVHRVELSNTAQGLELSGTPGVSWTLVLPHVLVAVRRACPLGPRDLDAPCDHHHPCLTERWHHPTIPTLIRHHNALYYPNVTLPPNMSSLPIDRVVETALGF